MKILTENDCELLDMLIKSELEIIEKGFLVSDFTGKVFLSNSINDFKNIHLYAKYGDIIPSICTEYRYFIIGLLKNINEKFRTTSIQEVLIPTVGNLPTEELLKVFENKNIN